MIVQLYVEAKSGAEGFYVSCAEHKEMVNLNETPAPLLSRNEQAGPAAHILRSTSELYA